MLKQTAFLKRRKPLQSRSVLRSGSKRLASRTRLKPVENPDIRRADNGIRHYVFRRDQKCVRCGCIANLTPSHFHSRRHSTTRWLPENIDTLCTWCHQMWEYQKNPGQEYFEWKRTQLGDIPFALLEEKATMKGNETQSLNEALKFLEINQLLEITHV